MSLATQYAALEKQITSGPPLDIDKSGDFDCVDVPKDWAQHLFPGVGWPTLIGYGNAIDLFVAANPKYFQKIPFKRGMALQQGDILVCGPTSAPGYTNQYENPYGHTGVLHSYNASTYTMIQQDSGTGEKPHPATWAWDYRPITGVLRPLVSNSQEEAPMNKGDVINMYQALLGRPADDAGLKSFVGKPWNEVFHALTHSTEYTNRQKKVSAALAAKPTVLKPGTYLVK